MRGIIGARVAAEAVVHHCLARGRRPRHGGAMPDLRPALSVLRDPVLAGILALHVAAFLAAASAPRWAGPGRAWGIRVLLLGVVLPAALVLRLIAFLAAAPPGTTSVPAAAMEFAATVFPYTWFGPTVAGLAWMPVSGSERHRRWVPHVLVSGSLVGLAWALWILARAARTWVL